MTVVELSETPEGSVRLEVEVAESEGVVRLWFDGDPLDDLPLSQATDGAMCAVDGGHRLAVRVEMKVGQPGVIATLDDAPLVPAVHPTETPTARVALAALVTIVLGAFEAIGGALVGGINLLLIFGFFTAGLGVLLSKTQDSAVAFVVLLVAGGSLLLQVALLLLYVRVPIWVLLGPLFGFVFVARGFGAAQALARRRSTAVEGSESRGDPFDAPKA